MSSSPLVSVLMPVRNGRKFLADAIESIRGQTLQDWEFCIVDDGSTDDTPVILKSFQEKDARVRFISRGPSRGLPKTINECFRMSGGEFLARMDCDDIAMPDRFERQVTAMRADPALVCVGGSFEQMDSCGRRLNVLYPPFDHEGIEQKTLAGHGAICHPTAMIRRSAMEQINGYYEDEPLAEDLDLWLRLGEAGKLANLREPVLRYRLHEGSVSETKCMEQRRCALLACQRAWKRRGIQGNFEAADAWRPGTDARSKAAYALRYGWWAYGSGERSTALHYGIKALKNTPLNREGWRLVACAVLKPARRAAAS